MELDEAHREGLITVLARIVDIQLVGFECVLHTLLYPLSDAFC